MSQLRLALIEQRTAELVRKANRISRAAHSARKRIKAYQQRHLPVVDSGFTAVAGVPASRQDCPTTGVCPHVRCKFHLAMEDAEHRAGRPGLGSVPRDSRGLTIATPGHAGNDRPGTTLRPIWLELERTCRVALYWGDDGRVKEVEPLVPVTSQRAVRFTFRKRRVGTWDMVEDRLHPGERLEVYDDNEQHVASAFWMPDRTLAFDRNPYATSVTLVRVRGVSACALDEVQRNGRMSNEQVGDAIGRHRTLVAREVRRALGKAVRVASTMGMSEADLLRGLRELGAGQ